MLCQPHLREANAIFEQTSQRAPKGLLSKQLSQSEFKYILNVLGDDCS